MMEQTAAKKRTILVTDDNRDVNEVIKVMLRQNGYEVVQAFDGEEALLAFNRSQPDLVLLDYRMPGMDGIDVLRSIKEHDPTALVVFMTGEGSEDVAVQAMKAEADDYITKPISYPELLQLTNNLIRDHDIMLENLRLKERGDAYKDYLTTITETMGEAVVTLEDAGHIRFLNATARNLWGSEEMLKGRTAEVLFDNAGGEGLLADVREALSEGHERFEGEYTFRRADASTFTGLLTASMLKSEKYSGGIVLVIKDLTDLEEMRRQVINAEKLASLGKVVEGVAHEVRNSLTSLGGFSRRLDRSQDLSDDQHVYVDYIIDDVKRLEQMIMDIEEYVNYTKIHRPQFVPADIQSIIDQALIKTLAPGHYPGVCYEVNVVDDVDELVADHNYLVEAFNHLFENACEAMVGKGKIEVQISANQNYLIVDTIDTGHGIPGDEIKDIFNPFYTSKVTGAGIGLSKVYLIVEEHRGFITVHSVVNEGTRVRVCLPRKKGSRRPETL